jgi:hypothetical protein
MSIAEERQRKDRLKRERDYAEHVSGGIKQRGNEKSNEATQYKGATDQAGIINRYMKHRGEE